MGVLDKPPRLSRSFFQCLYKVLGDTFVVSDDARVPFITWHFLAANVQK